MGCFVGAQFIGFHIWWLLEIHCRNYRGVSVFWLVFGRILMAGFMGSYNN
jgi:hypothetical protein